MQYSQEMPSLIEHHTNREGLGALAPQHLNRNGEQFTISRIC